METPLLIFQIFVKFSVLVAYAPTHAPILQRCNGGGDKPDVEALRNCNTAFGAIRAGGKKMQVCKSEKNNSPIRSNAATGAIAFIFLHASDIANLIACLAR